MSEAMIQGRNVTDLVPRSPRNLIDRDLQENIKTLTIVRNSFDKVDKMVRKAFDLETNRGKRWLARTMGYLTPKFLYEHMPEGMVTFIAEEYDVLELIEHKMRDQINNAQASLRNIANCAVAKKQEINELRSDLEQAKREEWDAQQLHQYITEKAGILVDPEIEQLLDEQFTVLSFDEREGRRTDLFNQLEANAAIGDENLAITKKTPFEELVERINQDPVNLKRDIFRQIMSAYFFLRVVLHIVHRKITIEEFEVAHQRLKELADRNSKSDAKEFLAKGYFTRWDISWIDNQNHSLHKNHVHTPFAPGDLEYETFDPEGIEVYRYIRSGKYALVFPPNIIELMNEIYAKRHPDLAETTPRQ